MACLIRGFSLFAGALLRGSSVFKIISWQQKTLIKFEIGPTVSSRSNICHLYLHRLCMVTNASILLSLLLHPGTRIEIIEGKKSNLHCSLCSH